MSNTLFMISFDNNMISSFSDAHKLEGGGFNIFDHKLAPLPTFTYSLHSLFCADLIPIWKG